MLLAKPRCLLFRTAGCFQNALNGSCRLCLAAYPDPAIVFLAAYNNSNPATEYDPMNPLNEFVEALFPYYTPMFIKKLCQP